jgi:hypothetical protein
VAIDRTSKFVFAQLHEVANVKSAVGFLQALIEAVPYTIHIVLTDNGIHFGDMPSRRTGPRRDDTVQRRRATGLRGFCLVHCTRCTRRCRIFVVPAKAMVRPQGEALKG